MNAQIVCRLKGGGKLTFNVREGESVLGREAGLAVAVPAEGVSRRHAKISWDGASYWIEDLKSTNGTFVNGFDVAREGKERLRHLDVITLGRAIELLFLVREAPTGVVKRLGVVSASLVSEEGDVPYEIAVGELTLGRSAANNVVVDSSAVSKLHAKIQRTTDHVVLQDLNSSNGTFVNGARVMTALLQDGDRLALAGVASYRVKIEMGEVQSLPEARVTPSSPSEESPEFSADWKTRYEWDSGEYADLMALRQRITENEQNDRTTPLKAVGTPRGAAARPAAPAAKPPAPAAARPSAPAAKSDAAPAAPAAAAKPPAAPSAPKPTAPPAPPAAKPAAPAGPPAPPPTQARPPAAPKPAAPAPAPPVARAIARVRLSGPEGDLVVSEPGTYEMGRLSEVPLRIVHPTVSRRQAKLTLSADRRSVRIEHTGSSPTLLNGKLLNDAAPLADGDRLQLGEVVLAVRIEH